MRASASPPDDELSLLAGEDWGPRAWLRLFRDLYCAFDRRTLGFTRILLGFLLLADLCHRGRLWRDLYSSEGLLPVPLHLRRPEGWGAFSIFHAFVSPAELTVLWVVMAVNAVCLMVGYRTRLAQVVALVLHTGMNARLLLVENGGHVLQNLLLLWTVFLPLGDRFSVDALLASLRRRRESTAAELGDREALDPPSLREPHVSLVGLVIMAQIAVIYFFNVVHKTGYEWKNGTAVHYVLYLGRMVTPIAAGVRDHLPGWAVIFMTRATLAMEAAIPVLLLQPLSRTWARRGVIFMMCTLHLAFGVTLVLGPFAWSACVLSTLLFSSEDWEIAAATMRRARRARAVLFDPRSGGAVLACRVLARLDRFRLLSFAEREGLPLGIAVEGQPVTMGETPKPPAQPARAGMVADLVEALPLGPIVAWIPRLPGVRAIVEAALAFVEQREVSGFFGLAAPAPGGHDEGPEAPLRLAGRAALGALREGAVLLMFVASINEGLVELTAIRNRVHIGQPEALRVLTHKARFLQGWFMFSPRPPDDDGSVVVDALTVEGRHVDPFTGRPPSWDVSSGSLGLDQSHADYFFRIQLAANTVYREAMKDYLYRLPERTGRPGDALVSGDVYWVHEKTPRWNETAASGYERAELFSFESPSRGP